MLTLFALGSLGFWILLAVETVVLLALIEHERPWVGSLTLIVTGALLHFFGGINLVALAVENPGGAGLLLGLYFVAGAVWATVKWFLFVLRKKEDYLEAKERWRPQDEMYQHSNSKEAEAKLTWDTSNMRRHYLNSKGGLAPLVRENKERVMLWMVYWPWSAVWTVINDPIKRLFRAIFNMLQDTLQAISNRVWQDVK